MDQALVSVGVPTYNRPKGLRRTLSLITGQTYANLEIIISDNCSPDPLVQDVIDEYLQKDSRIQSYRQDENMGPAYNFSYVLRKAEGEFFMWAADDDEWDDQFISKCIAAIGDYSSVMTNFTRINRYHHEETEVALAAISPSYTIYENLMHHFQRMTPHILYGLHRKRDITWMLGSKMYDWWDCYFVSRLLVEGNGVVLLGDCLGFKAGTDTETHIYKPFNAEKGMQYLPFIKNHINLIIDCDQLSIKQKVVLLDKVILVSLNLYGRHNKEDKPYRVRVLSALVKARMKIQSCLGKIFKSSS